MKNNYFIQTLKELIEKGSKDWGIKPMTIMKIDGDHRYDVVYQIQGINDAGECDYYRVGTWFANLGNRFVDPIPQIKKWNIYLVSDLIAKLDQLNGHEIEVA